MVLSVVVERESRDGRIVTRVTAFDAIDNDEVKTIKALKAAGFKER